MTAKSSKANAGTSAGTPRPELPPTAYPGWIENYTPERMAEFLLNNAVTPADYAAALEEVRQLGIDPATIPHEKPVGA